ncbi:glycoside hydrolase family protein [Enterobacter sp. C4G1]|uniref:glycoside hydrolase family protein n=1 Tax=Enterobacter sp. C4G1 TaxID=3458724 RepID=UPI0040687794
MATLKERLKVLEGTKQYQTKMKYYRKGKFWIYKDSEGFDTIGYGHFVHRGEDFSTGLTEDEADKLLDHDIQIAINNMETLNIWLPDDWRDFMVIMIFQLGLGGVQKFKKMLQALRDKNYPEAVEQAKDSLWYKQTPNRLNAMIAELTNK